MKATSWLLLLFSLPTNRKTERVAVWRRLRKMGAVPIKTSTYLLPDEPPQAGVQPAGRSRRRLAVVLLLAGGGVAAGAILATTAGGGSSTSTPVSPSAP